MHYIYAWCLKFTILVKVVILVQAGQHSRTIFIVMSTCAHRDTFVSAFVVNSSSILPHVLEPSTSFSLRYNSSPCVTVGSHSSASSHPEPFQIYFHIIYSSLPWSFTKSLAHVTKSTNHFVPLNYPYPVCGVSTHFIGCWVLIKSIIVPPFINSFSFTFVPLCHISINHFPIFEN